MQVVIVIFYNFYMRQQGANLMSISMPGKIIIFDINFYRIDAVLTFSN